MNEVLVRVVRWWGMWIVGLVLFLASLGFYAWRIVDFVERPYYKDFTSFYLTTDTSHGERSDGEYSAIGADFLSSVSEHKKSLRAVESFESPCGAAARSRSVGDEDESRPTRLSPSRVDFCQEGKNLSRAVRHSGKFFNQGFKKYTDLKITSPKSVEVTTSDTGKKTCEPPWAYAQGITTSYARES